MGSGNFANGIFTTPALGVYHCCASFRCKQGGYCDFTVIRNGGTVYAAFGTRNTGINHNGWSSHSTCWTNRATQGITWWLNLESGQVRLYRGDRVEVRQVLMLL